MKRALNLFLHFLLVMSVGILLGTIFGCLYLDIRSISIEDSSKIFQKTHILKSLFFSIQIMIFFTGPFLSYYVIRRNSNLASFITYILICAFCYLVFYPLSYNLKNHVYSKVNFENDSSELTKGYFRKTGEKIIYLQDDSSAIVIDTSPIGQAEFTKDFESELDSLKKDSSPFNDVLVKEAFNEKLFEFPKYFSSLNENALNSLDKGFSFYAGFLSMGLALCSSYAFCKLFAWRLTSAVVIFIYSALILILNIFSFRLPFFSEIYERFSKTELFLNVSNYVENPVLTLINVVVSLIVILIGTINFIHRKTKAKRNSK